jgi:hypothetical protein
MAALLPRQDDVLVASFREGRIYSPHGGIMTEIAIGPADTYCLEEDGTGGLLVGALGSDTIMRIFL